jgi:hypothetical protein
MSSPRLGLVGLVVAVACVLSACGGGDDGNVDEAEWRIKAEAVCVQARAGADAARPVTGAGNPAVPVRARAALASQLADDLAALGRPVGQVSEAQALVEALDDQAQSLDRLADELLSDPTASAGSLGSAATVAADRVTDAATALELPSCTAEAALNDPATTGDPTGNSGIEPGSDEGVPGE